MLEPVRRRIAVGSAQLDVLVGGSESATATVCTGHPLQSMHGVLPLLADVTQARVVCVDPRGVGDSSPPEHPHDSTLQAMADDLDSVRQALGVARWTIWGMSGGSMIAQVYALRHPGSLEALILDSAGPCFAETLRDPACMLSPSYPKWRDALAAAGLAVDGGGGAPAMASEDDTLWQEVPGAGWVLRRGTGPALLIAPSEPSPRMRRVMSLALAFDARPWLHAIRVPTLVVSGTADEVAPPAHLRALHEAIPGSSFALIDGAGHVPMGEKPSEVAAAVQRFLSERVFGHPQSPISSN
jgi:pimeloyl-ACP methyl ester carboxylesterase